MALSQLRVAKGERQQRDSKGACFVSFGGERCANRVGDFHRGGPLAQPVALSLGGPGRERCVVGC